MLILLYMRIGRLFFCNMYSHLLFFLMQGYKGPRKTREDAERYTDMLLQSYQTLNGFLCAYIDRSLSAHQYEIRKRFFLEKMLDYEFRVQTRSNLDGQINNFLIIGRIFCFQRTKFIILFNR